MGVIIKNMKMPDHCGYCRFRYDGICHALQKTQYSKEECPLVPVLSHGRLIDVDELLNKLKKLFDRRENDARFTNKIGGFVTWNDAIYYIKTAPTIIEADKEEKA